MATKLSFPWVIVTLLLVVGALMIMEPSVPSAIANAVFQALGR